MKLVRALRTPRSGLGALVCAAAVLSVLPATPASAEHRRHHRHDPYQRYVRVPPDYHPYPIVTRGRFGRSYRPIARFVVPSVINRVTFRFFRPYFRGTVYYRDHSHHHSVYEFPVRTDRGWTDERYYYCRGELYR